ncbi:MAG TPA: molybdopterin-binding protein [Alphaproteobacteria bacterium]|nr:molybdopterin-binding protein [Alphaproteobacteria bacterium]
MSMTDQSPATARIVTAAILVIGDEILSGRTQDTNSSYIARWLGELGIRLREIRVVPDIETEIIAALNALRGRYDYVFTTGGIGPTHDDITADAVAAAFGVPIGFHPEAMAILAAHYKPGEFTEARQRMARIPDGAALIDNPISKAPGFHIGNVFVLAGVPMIMQAMLDSLRHRVTGGVKLLSASVGGAVAEGHVAGPLGALQKRFPEVSLGSYPYFRRAEPGSDRISSYGVNFVLRSTDAALLAQAREAVRDMIRAEGAEPEDRD